MSRPLRYLSIDRPARGRDLSVLAVLVALSLGFSALSPERQVFVSQQLQSTVLYPFLKLHEAFAEHAVTTGRVASLTEERDSLAAELAVMRRAASQVGDLRGLLALEGLQTGDFLLADLVPGRPRIGESHSFLVTKGRRDGVDPPVGVIAGNGLVGIVRSARSGAAAGHFWTHPEFRVSVRTESGDAIGIVRPWRDDNGHLVMELEGTPYQEEVPLGSLLVTSGVAGLYPAGVPVGTVRAVSEVRAGWSKSYLVEPAARPEEAGVVLLWRRPPAPE